LAISAKSPIFPGFAVVLKEPHPIDFGSPVIEWNRKYQANREEVMGGAEVAHPARHMFISGGQ
jgi:hypothetical protein